MSEPLSWVDWIASVRSKFWLPPRVKSEDRPTPTEAYWQGYEACLQDVERQVAALAAVPAHTPGDETDALRRAVGDFLDARRDRRGSRRMLDCIEAMHAAYEAASPSEETR